MDEINYLHKNKHKLNKITKMCEKQVWEMCMYKLFNSNIVNYSLIFYMFYKFKEGYHNKNVQQLFFLQIHSSYIDVMHFYNLTIW